MTGYADSVVSSLNWYLPMGVVSLLLLVFLWFKRTEEKEVRKSIVSVSGIPVLTKFLSQFLSRPANERTDASFSDNLLPILDGLSHAFRKHKIFRGDWGGHYYYICFNAGIAEKILHSSIALNKDWVYKLLHPWLGTGLLTSGDRKWRTRRKMLTPAFHFRILKDFLLIFNEQTKILVEKLRKQQGEVIDITSIMALCTLDIIGESAMGVRLNAQEGGTTEYVLAVKSLTATVIKQFSTPWHWITPLYNLTPTAKEMRKNLAIVHNFAREVTQKRKEKFLKEDEVKQIVDDFQDDDENVGVKKRRAFLDLLLYHHITDNSLSEEDIREEVDTFTFEGHDTTSMALSWTLYLLGWHKDVQEKAYQELWEIYSDEREQTVTTDHLKRMRYLECVIKETLRLFPSVPFVSRQISRDIEADEYIIPADSSVVVMIYSIHHDPSIYPNPEVFDPDRFSPENSVRRHPFAYIPFSAGSRNCIGQRFAMMELKTVLSYILRNFKISSLDHRDKLRFVGDIILRPKEEIRLVLNRR